MNNMMNGLFAFFGMMGVLGGVGAWQAWKWYHTPRKVALTVTLALWPGQIAHLREHAKAHNLALERYLVGLIEQDLAQ